ncbi:cell wall surface anchor family protein, putative [Microscilla marina ATCC 23134]|uniref:Cell wall surface anchor family protein, putative n=1 Tax=Microscilla marina ATCC 23134 TaxID=313606 RepID=A1ZC17_MICM2|nr:cell wall surface anchor family protein, putative [Microscilla marina ATCC 23134]
MGEVPTQQHFYDMIEGLFLQDDTVYKDVNSGLAIQAGIDTDKTALLLYTEATSDPAWQLGIANGFELKDSAGNTQWMVTNDGNVGVGTNDPAGKKLFVQGDTRLSGSVEVWNDQVEGIENSWLYDLQLLNVQEVDNTFSRMMFNSYSSALAAIGANRVSEYQGDLHFQTRNGPGFLTTKMHIRHDGNVGIGTTNPVTKLHVQDGAMGTIPENALAVFESNQTRYLQLMIPATTYETGVLFGKGADYVNGGIIYDKDNAMHLRTGGNQTRVFVHSGGNVGIGTITPDSTLTIDGTLGFYRNGPSAVNVTVGYINYQDYLTIGTHSMADGIQFKTGATGSHTTKMWIANNGNVGIGTTSPSNTLHVAGSAFMNSLDIAKPRNVNGTSDGIAINPDNSLNYIELTYDYWGGSHGLLFNCYKNTNGGSLSNSNNLNHANSVGDYQSGAGAVVFDANGGNMYFLISGHSSGKDTPVNWDGSILTLQRGGNATFKGMVSANGSQLYSDARFKKDITPITTGLIAKLDQLQGNTYQWRNDEFTERNFVEGTQLGFIAQEMQEVFPELVSADSDGYLSINYTGLIPVLTEAHKQQQQNIEAQQAQIDSLVVRMVALENMLAAAKN